MAALRAGAVMPTPNQMGRRVDLPDAMRAKMESAFGADLSAVKLYESEAVADAGANAVTRGSDIAFAPGMLDFTSYGGQALLGHEISHVVSQARGEVTGGGFLNDHALEARADREGAMAAAGQQIAMPVASMSSVTAAPAAGPMQADKAEEKQRKAESNAKLDRLFRTASGIKAREDISREEMNEYYDTVEGLTDEELDMLGERRGNATRSLNKYYRKQKGSEGERLLRTATSDSSTDAAVYEDIIEAFQTSGTGFCGEGESFALRSKESSKRVTKGWSPFHRWRVQKGDERAKGASESNPYVKTDEGLNLRNQRVDEQIERMRRIYREGK